MGLQFLFSTLLWFLVGGLLALAIRWQLAWPWTDMPMIGRMLFSGEGGQISPEFYTMLFTMHATVMIFFVIIPILAGAFGNFLIPLMIGADDMAFPTLNMLSYWFMWPAFICIGLSFFTAGNGAGGRLDLLSAAVGGLASRARERYGTDAVAAGCHLCRHLVDDGFGELHDHDHPDAGTGHDDVSPAADDLGDVHHGDPAGFRVARADGGRLHAADGSHCWERDSSSRKA